VSGSGEFGKQWSNYQYFWIGDGPDRPRYELRFRDVIPLEDDGLLCRQDLQLAPVEREAQRALHLPVASSSQYTSALS
jgi:hypothetical protein